MFREPLQDLSFTNRALLAVCLLEGAREALRAAQVGGSEACVPHRQPRVPRLHSPSSSSPCWSPSSSGCSFAHSFVLVVSLQCPTTVGGAVGEGVPPGSRVAMCSAEGVVRAALVLLAGAWALDLKGVVPGVTGEDDIVAEGGTAVQRAPTPRCQTWSVVQSRRRALGTRPPTVASGVVLTPTAGAGVGQSVTRDGLCGTCQTFTCWSCSAKAPTVRCWPPGTVRRVRWWLSNRSEWRRQGYVLGSAAERWADRNGGVTRCAVLERTLTICASPCGEASAACASASRAPHMPMHTALIVAFDRAARSPLVAFPPPPEHLAPQGNRGRYVVIVYGMHARRPFWCALSLPSWTLFPFSMARA